MPLIKYKKKTYAGGSMPVLEMTKAQYDALSEAKKNDGTIYLITDGTGGWEAENSVYDNTESGLTATNVQDAIDELNSNVTGLGTQIQPNTALSMLTKPGRYYCDADVSTITGGPYGLSTYTCFDLIVMKRANNERRWQIMFAYKTDEPSIFYRAMTGANTYSLWRKVTAPLAPTE